MVYKFILTIIFVKLNIINLQFSDQPCEIINFDLGDTINTKLTCKTPIAPTTNLAEYPGGRGINFIRDNILTTYNNLLTAQPSQNAQYSFNDKLSFKDNQYTDVTIWFKGFLTPGKDSNYEFQLETNGNAILLLSTDSSSSNKVVYL
jgi:hypothetical protein